MNYSVCEQSKIVMSWPQVGAHTSLGCWRCWHNFSLIPPLTAAAAWLFMKKSEKISRIFECAEVFHFALEQHPALMLLLVVWHLYNHAKKVEVSCCQSSCSPAQASPPPSLAICQLFKTFPTIWDEEDGIPLFSNLMFSSRIALETIQVQTIEKFEFEFLHIVKVIRGACFVFVVLPFSWPDFVRWCWCHDVSPPPPQSIKSSFSFDFLVTCRPALQFL